MCIVGIASPGATSALVNDIAANAGPHNSASSENNNAVVLPISDSVDSTKATRMIDGDVLRHLMISLRSVGSGAASMAAAVHRDNTVSFRDQGRNQVTKVVGIPEATVKRQHGNTRRFLAPFCVPNTCAVYFCKIRRRFQWKSRCRR